MGKFWSSPDLSETPVFRLWILPIPLIASRLSRPWKMDGPFQDDVHIYGPHISTNMCLTGN